MAKKRNLDSNKNAIAKQLPNGEVDKQYEVGYCRPPKSTQFKKGVSGNRSGRPRKRKSGVAQVFSNVFEVVVKANVGGKIRYIDGHEAVFLQLRAKAISGDPQSIRLYLNFCKQFGINHSDEGNIQLKGLFDALKAGPVDTP
jgi:hypothetical protein